MGLSLGHLLILAVVLLLFGTKRLPALATALGKSMRAFREALDGSGGGRLETAERKGEKNDPRNT